jgi:cobalamin-dependent methionine synthase I
MAVTIGSAIEDEIDNLFLAKEYTKGLIMDAAATTATEMVADQLNRYIDELAAKRGFKTTWRYSPGYGDWPLAQQSALVKAIHADKIGITLTTSCMLMPRKSVTAIIGLKRTADFGCGPSGCAGCSMHGCASRKE